MTRAGFRKQEEIRINRFFLTVPELVAPHGTVEPAIAIESGLHLVNSGKLGEILV